MTAYAASRTAWFQQLALISITAVLVLQNTKQALLPAKPTPVLWAAELAAIAGVGILRSGWLRDTRWQDKQLRLGTLANNFYKPRREALLNGFAVGGGVLGALWWAGGARGGVRAVGRRADRHAARCPNSWLARFRDRGARRRHHGQHRWCGDRPRRRPGLGDTPSTASNRAAGIAWVICSFASRKRPTARPRSVAFVATARRRGSA